MFPSKAVRPVVKEGLTAAATGPGGRPPKEGKVKPEPSLETPRHRRLFTSKGVYLIKEIPARGNILSYFRRIYEIK